MTKNIYFHIGFGKTGTTALQECLSKYQKILERNGFEYIELPSDFFTAFHSLYKDHCKSGDMIVNWIYYNWFSNAIRKGIEDRISEVELVKQIKERINTSKFQNVIFSWEGIMDTKPAMLSDKLDLLLKIISNCGKVTLIIYVRNQAKFIRSNYQVTFRPQYEVSFDQYYNCFDFASHMRLPETHTLNYYELIKMVEASFPYANIIVKAYDLVVKNQDIFRNFCYEVGVTHLEPHAISRKTNESLNFPSHLAMQLSNGILPRKDAARLFYLLRKYPISSQYLKYEFPSPQQSQCIMGYYQESNRKLFEKYNLGSNEEYCWWQNAIDQDNQLSIESRNQLYENIIRYFINLSSVKTYTSDSEALLCQPLPVKPVSKVLKHHSVLYAFFDFKTIPPTLEIIRFLILAELERKKIDCDEMQVVFVVDAPEMVTNHVKNYTRFNSNIDEDYIYWRFRNVHVQSCWLMPSVKQIHVFTCRHDARFFESNFVKHVFPPAYKVDKPTDSCRYVKINLASMDAVMPSIQTTAQSKRFVREWLKNNALDRKVVSITLREGSLPSRRSNIKDWVTFAKRLDSSVYSPVFIRDTERALSLLPPSELKDQLIFSEIPWNIELRSALYELSYLNLMNLGGPGCFCDHNPKTKFIMFNPINESAGTQFFLSNYWEPGTQNNFTTPLQKVVWEKSTLSLIEKEFYEMCKKIEKFNNASLSKLIDYTDYYMKMGCIQSADWASSLAVEKFEKNPVAWLHRAVTLRVNNQPKEALIAINNSIQIENTPEALAERELIRNDLTH